ncbi:hypothetical protein N9C14_02165 [Gammaproteobacteria bacterium]|nr:hypothetical protein [Gammaproteobacteria bacterium]
MADYPSRFSSISEAIAYAEANGQGSLTVQSDGVVTNQNGEIMVYDSDGNLAPGGGMYELAPVPVPVRNQPRLQCSGSLADLILWQKRWPTHPVPVGKDLSQFN